MTRNPRHVVAARPPRGQVQAPRREGPGPALEALLEDAARHRGEALAVVHPASEGEWAWLLRHEPVVLPVGAQSSLTGAAIPRGGVVATTGGRAGILSWGEETVRVQAGVIVADLVARLAGRGRVLPPVPTYQGALVGGTVATNAAGAASFKHGAMRSWVSGLTVVLASGDVLDIERGQCLQHDEGWFELRRCDGGVTRIPVPSHRLPEVPKCSAGYLPGPGLDLIDLFIGSEGTLGVVTEAELKVLPVTTQPCGVLALFETAERGYEAVRRLRAASSVTRAGRDPCGVDVAAIEHADASCLRLLERGGASRRLGARLRPAHELALFITVDLPLQAGPAEACDELARLDEPGADGPLLRLARILREAGGLDDAHFALPGDAGGLARLAALREAIPEAVNARIHELRRSVDLRLRKSGGDVIVPFARLGELVAACRDLPAARGLEVLTWGHVAEAHLHPNLLPRSVSELQLVDEVQLEIGRLALALGGSPLAEHGVGRSPVKQALLAELVGPAGLVGLRAVKAALDPERRLAPGVLLA